MATVTSIVRGDRSTANESGFFESVQTTAAVSHAHVSGAETEDMSPRTRTIVYLSLVAGVLFLWEHCGLCLARILFLAKYPVALVSARRDFQLAHDFVEEVSI